MKTTVQLLEEARQNLPKEGHPASFYRIAKVMGITDQSLYHLRKYARVMTDEQALKIMHLLPYPPEVVLLWLHMEREKNPDVLKVLERAELRLSAA